MKICNENNLKVVPQGGNTGLVGGSVGLNDEITINLKKMNKILDFNQKTDVITCESGCILDNL